MLKQWLESYQAQSIGETNNAMREILQEIALAGLYRAGFYKHAAFYGGTALRILKKNLIESDVDFKKIKDDIVRFIAPKDDQTAIWNAKYFTDLTDLIKIQ